MAILSGWALTAAPLPVFYGIFLVWRLGVLKRATKRGATVGPHWLAVFCTQCSKLLAGVNGVKVKSTGGEGLKAESKQYCYVWHPHGFISYVPAFLMGEMAVKGQPHNRTWYGTCIPLMFNIPFIGEHFMLTNARPVDKKSVESLLMSGASIAIQPGGVQEQAASLHNQEQAFFPPRLGWIRMAIKHGTPLMPLYIFGENQLYRRVNGMEWLSKLIKKATGMTLPIVTAKWGLPMAGLLPRATDIHIRFGNEVAVGKKEDEPSEERVQEVFERYKAELNRLFNANAAECLPPEVAAKGLKIVVPEEHKKRA